MPEAASSPSHGCAVNVCYLSSGTFKPFVVAGAQGRNKPTSLLLAVFPHSMAIHELFVNSDIVRIVWLTTVHLDCSVVFEYWSGEGESGHLLLQNRSGAFSGPPRQSQSLQLFLRSQSNIDATLIIPRKRILSQQEKGKIGQRFGVDKKSTPTIQGNW